MSKKYAVAYILTYPCGEDPDMESLEIFGSFNDAKKRSEEIAEEFVDDFGEDYIEVATKDSPVTIMSNGEVTGYAYIVEVG